MFILNPDLNYLPTYRIGPFVTESITRNFNIYCSFIEYGENYLNIRFGKNNWLITKNGRQAISLALQGLLLPKDAITTVLTTSDNFYISGCVTSSIENHTNWNRHKNSQTGAYLVNHEFGYLYPKMEELVKEGLPIIEDCCTTFFSQDESQNIGNYGDFSVYSFPKFFSIQIGGLLVGNGVGLNDELFDKIGLSKEEKEYILKVVGYELTQEDKILIKRKENFDYATELFEQLGFTLRFPNKDGVVPSLLLLNNNGIIKDLNSNKDYLNLHGIQNSVFYGEDAFFIPNHNMLSFKDIDYFICVIKKNIRSNE